VIWVVVVLGLVLLWGILIYNGLVRARNESRNAWSQIEVQLKRRHDLVPNLVEAVRGYAKHEATTLEQVVRARSAAVNAGSARDAGAAEGALGQALARLFVLAEGYPSLLADRNFRALQEELSSTENRIAFARQAYNDAATRYNNRRETFPGFLFAGRFPRADLFEIPAAGERSVPSARV
jgi:LemA protein